MLPPNCTRDVTTLARFVFENQAPWFYLLMRLRDALVSVFMPGVQTSAQMLSKTQATPPPHELGTTRIYIFRVFAIYQDEIILGEDDKHLDFRSSILLRPPSATATASTPTDKSKSESENENEREIVFTTVVHCHNMLGRAYIALIAPFHRAIVRSNLRRAARNGWPSS